MILLMCSFLHLLCSVTLSSTLSSNIIANVHTPPPQKPRPLVPPPDEIMTPGRRSKRNSVANAVTVTGVTEALLVGE